MGNPVVGGVLIEMYPKQEYTLNLKWMGTSYSLLKLSVIYGGEVFTSLLYLQLSPMKALAV